MSADPKPAAGAASGGWITCVGGAALAGLLSVPLFPELQADVLWREKTVLLLGGNLLVGFLAGKRTE